MVFIHALRKRRISLALLTPAVHIGAALATLANFSVDGCLVTVPLLITLGVLMATLAAFLAWRVALRPAPLLREGQVTSSVHYQ